MYAYLGKSYHGSTEKCDGLVSLPDHSTKITSVRNMLLDGHIFVVVVFNGETFM